jgi:general stress protein 26
MEGLLMPPVADESQRVEVNRLLAGAAKLIGSVPNCWLVTLSEAGSANARPMGRVPPPPDRNDWKFLFLTDGRSRKASDIRRACSVKLIFQRNPDEAFAALAGLASLIDDTTDVTRLWKKDYDRYFPTEADRANAAFIEVAVDQMELWIRGVTPEPFGLQPTIVERIDEGEWRLRASPS